MTTATAEERVTESMGVLARGSAMNFAGSAYNFASRLVFNLIIARLLGPSQLGIYFISLTVASALGVLCLGGFDLTMVRFLARYRADRNWGALRGATRFASWVVSGVGLLGFIALFFAAPWVAGTIFHKPELTTPLRIMGIYGPLFGLDSLLLAATQSFKVMKYKVYIDSVLNPTLRIVLVVAVFLLGGGLNEVLGAYVFAILVCTVLAYWALRRCLPSEAAQHPTVIHRGELLRYANPLLGVNLVTFLILYADSLILAHFRSSQEVGLYSVCLRLIVVSGFALAMVSQAFAPMIAELQHRRRTEELAVYFKVVTLWVVEAYVPIALLFVVAPTEILGVFGKGFTAAAPCLIILAVAQLVNVITGPLGLMLNMTGWTRLELWNTFTVLALQVTLAFLLIPRIGYLGAAFADGTAAVAVNLVRLFQLRRRLGIHPFSRHLAKPLLAAAVALCATIPLLERLTPGGTWRVLLLLLAMMMAYFGMLAFLGLDHHSRLAWQQLRWSLKERLFQSPIHVASGKEI